ncbi:hypothetical protein ACEZDB_11340 [Streptacidiphilus sp. N1-3]|uniref:Zinc-finger n=1 Tax=Streptacidiphilus alkalitolerans TaxID=3342712 RepID=A0ABV6WZU7_9ACTN
MSPTPPNPVLDSSGHPPVETIAEDLEALLPPEDAALLHAHVADCRDCRDTRAALEEIRSLLGQTATPVLPAEIGIRIDAALAAEALLATAPGPADPAGADRPAAPAADRTDRTDDRAGDAPGKPRSASSAPTGPLRPPRGPGRARRWRRAALGVAALAVVGLISTAVLQSGNGGMKAGSGSAKSVAGAGAANPRTDGAALVVFSDASLDEQIQQLLPDGAGSTALQPQAHPQTDGGVSTGAPACVLAAVGRTGETPLASTRGSYRGTAVFAVVYTSPVDPLHKVDAYLVSASCADRGAHASDGAPGSAGATVLVRRTVPRG